MDDLTTRVARMMDDYRVGADGMLKDEAARAVVALVLDEAAKAARSRLYPKNPQDDWTDYAKIHAAAAIDADAAIRDLSRKATP